MVGGGPDPPEPFPATGQVARWENRGVDPTVALRLLQTPEFQRGLVAGLAALAIGLFMRRIRVDWGLLWAPTVGAALFWADVLNRQALERSLTRHGWVLPAAALTIAAVSYGLIKNRSRPELAPALALSLAGVWATVPDTEVISVLLGVTSAMVWLWWPRQLLPLRAAGALGIATVAAASGAAGSVGRPGAYVGAFGALAALALLSWPRRSISPWWSFAAHAALVIGWSRVAGLSRSAPTALAIGVGLTAVVGAATLWIPKAGRRTSRHR